MISTKERLSPEEELNELGAALHKKVRKPGIADKDIKTNQYTLAFGSKEEVRQEVIDNLGTLGKGGGYILAPCHNIQVVSPPENIVTMYDTAYEYGWN